MARLQAVELMPFRAAAAADLPSMMTAHVVFKAIDDTRPATLAPDVIQGLLRDEMGYGGLIVSDDLAMAAVAERAGPGEVAVEAIAAGCDVVLMRRPPAAQDEIFEALVRRAEADGGFQDRVFESAGRFAAFKSRCSAMPLPTAMLPSVLGTAGHGPWPVPLAPPRPTSTPPVPNKLREIPRVASEPQRPKAIAVFCGSRTGTSPGFAAQAHEVGQRLARLGITVVYGGGTLA